MEKPPRRSSKRKGATAKRRVIKKAKRELTLGQKLATTQKQILKLQEMIKKAVAHCGQDELDSEEWSIIAVTHFEYSVTRHPDDKAAIRGSKATAGATVKVGEAAATAGEAIGRTDKTTSTEGEAIKG